MTLIFLSSMYIGRCLMWYRTQQLGENAVVCHTDFSQAACVMGEPDCILNKDMCRKGWNETLTKVKSGWET